MTAGLIIGFISSFLLKIVAFRLINDYVLVEELIIKKNIEIYVFSALVFGVVNLTIRPIIYLISLPIHFITLGLSSIFVNGLLLRIWEFGVNFFIPNAIIINGFYTYIVMGVVMAIISWVIHWVTK